MENWQKDYKNDLINYLLSENNIQKLIDLIIKNTTIKPQAVSGCRKKITAIITDGINNLMYYPQSDAQMIEIVKIFNDQCYNNFCVYVMNKYPNKSIYKTTFNNGLSSKNNTIPVILSENELPHRLYNDVEPNMIIITEDEKNKLLEQYGIVENNISQMTSDTFLEYLTNPTVLQMFQLMIEQLNQYNPQNDLVNPNIKVDIVLTEEEVYNILQNESDHVEKNEKKIKNKKRKQILPPKKESKSENSDSQFEEDSINSIEDEEIIDSTEDEEIIDLSKGINNNTLILIEKRINKIAELKTTYYNKKNNMNALQINDKINKLDLEKKQLVNSIIEYKKKCKKSSKKTENKIGIIENNDIIEQKDPNVDFLNYELDPSDDYNDFKKINIKINSERKITEILLVNYYVPFNENNINRFNNIFSIYMGEKTFRIIIPPLNYSIQSLLNYIKSQITFLDFSIDKETVTIINTTGMYFDLITGDDTIFALLGFTQKSNNYKEKTSYTGSIKYDMECNKKLFFCLSGMAKDPVELEFDKKVDANIVLKNVRSGFNLKQLLLRFTNPLEQFYDFIAPVKICLRITYVPK